MPLNTNVPMRIVGGTTSAIQATAGVPKQIAADLDKHTLVLFDGVQMGGHPMAKAGVKIKAGTPNVKVNDGTEADLSGDIVITMIPGAIPGAISQVTDPEGQPAGEYLKFEYTTAEGNAAAYYVSLNALVDKYTAGQGIAIVDNQIRVNPKTLPPLILKEGGGLAAGADGKIYVDIEQIFDVGPDSPLQLVDGKITLKGVVSSDADNILKAGSDKLAFLPGDQGTL